MRGACTAEAGDALMTMGRTNEAIDRYIQAKAVGKVSQAAVQLVSAHRYQEALAVESALLAQLHDDFIDRSELAAVYAQSGRSKSRPQDRRKRKFSHALVPLRVSMR